jgi:hypothetical protein
MALCLQQISAAVQSYRGHSSSNQKTSMLKHLQQVMSHVRAELLMCYFHGKRDPRGILYADSLWWCQICHAYQQDCKYRITRGTEKYWISLICLACWTKMRNRSNPVPLIAWMPSLCIL